MRTRTVRHGDPHYGGLVERTRDRKQFYTLFNNLKLTFKKKGESRYSSSKAGNALVTCELWAFMDCGSHFPLDNPTANLLLFHTKKTALSKFICLLFLLQIKNETTCIEHPPHSSQVSHRNVHNSASKICTASVLRRT